MQTRSDEVPPEPRQQFVHGPNNISLIYNVKVTPIPLSDHNMVGLAMYGPKETMTCSLKETLKIFPAR